MRHRRLFKTSQSFELVQTRKILWSSFSFLNKQKILFLSLFFQHYTEEKQKSTNVTEISTATHNLQGVSQIPMPPPSYLYTSMSTLDSSNSTYPVRNEIRLNKRGFREQFDGIGHWRPLCIWAQCSKRAKKFSYCKRHYSEHLSSTSERKD